MALWQCLPLEVIRTGKNYRTTFTSITELAESIATHGLLENLVVIPANGGYEILAGERRYRALQLLREQGRWQSEVPCLIKDDSPDRIEALVENLQREEVPWWQLGFRFLELTEAGMSHKEIAERIGKRPGLVATSIQIARGLHPETIAALERLGTRNLVRAQVIRISCLVDLSTGKPDKVKQLERLEAYLSSGKVRRCGPRKEKGAKSMVYDRYRRLTRKAEAGTLGEVIDAFVRYLNGTDDRLYLPDLQIPKFTPRARRKRFEDV